VRARPVLLLTLPRNCHLLKPPHPVARRVLDGTDIRECGMRDVGAKGTLARGEQLPSWGGLCEGVRESEREREREREREGVELAREAGERTSNLSARSAFKSVWLEMDFDAARSSTLLRGSAAKNSPRVHGRTSGLSAMRARTSMRRPRQRHLAIHALVHSQIGVRVWTSCGTRALDVLRTCCDDTHLSHF
jgi:hypothetical protein